MNWKLIYGLISIKLIKLISKQFTYNQNDRLLSFYCRYELVGSNNISISSPDSQYYSVKVPLAERISVKTGDIIAVWYPKDGYFGVTQSRCYKDTNPEAEVSEQMC